MNASVKFLLLNTGLLMMLAAVGCGGKGFRSAPVSGVVTLNGKPLAEATVIFQPAGSGNPGPPSTATTDEEGRFTLLFSDQKPGAVVGKHKVVVSTRQFHAQDENSDKEEEVVKEQVPDAYRESPFEFEVPASGTNDAEINLMGPPPSNVPPGLKKKDLHG